MRIGKYLYAAAILVAVALAVGIWSPIPNQAKADKPDLDKGDSYKHHAPKPNVPRFVVDPFFPKPLPDNWVTGEVAGTCVDSKDHLITVNRGNLISPETLVNTVAPPVIEFDKDGNVVRAWGDRNVLPNGIHGCYVDYQDNVWIAGNGDGIVQKYSHDGTLMMQIGTRGLCDTTTGTCGSPGLNSSPTLLDQPADIAVDPENGDIYIADGYGNHRVVVFDKGGGFLRQWGNAGSGAGQFALADGGHPHCVVIGRDGLVYVCDRGQDRLQVFKKNPTNCTGAVPDRVCQPEQIIPVVPCTGNTATAQPCPGDPSQTVVGTAGSAWDLDFSADKKQEHMYDTDGGDEVVWIFDRAAALKGVWPASILGGFGRSGHQAGEFTFLHTIATDSKGNLYTAETINGRRIQRFKPEGKVPDKDLEDFNPTGSPGLTLEHYNPVK